MSARKLVKSCDCPAGGSTGQIWWEEPPPETGEFITFIACYEPRMACMTCHKPWIEAAEPSPGKTL